MQSIECRATFILNTQKIKKKAVMPWLSWKQKGETSVGDINHVWAAHKLMLRWKKMLFLFHMLFYTVQAFACSFKKTNKKSYKIISQTFKVAFVLHISSHISCSSSCELCHLCFVWEMWRISVGKWHKKRNHKEVVWLLVASQNTQWTIALFSTQNINWVRSSNKPEVI